MIRHVVLMQLLDRADAPEAKARLEALPPLIEALRSLEVVLDVLGNDGAFDLALVTTHDDAEGLAAYQAHPVHQDLLGWLRPRVAARAVVDAEV